MRPDRTIALITTAAAVTLAAACGGPTPAVAAPSPAPKIVTSTNVYGSIAQAVGGDRVAVTSLITDPAADPHSYDATPTDALTVAEAAIVVQNGGGYDDFMGKLVAAAGGQHTVIDVVDLSGFRQPGAADVNEHVWYSLPTAQRLATTLAGDLAKADAADAARFTSNAAAFTAKVDELARRAQAIGTAHPGTRVAVTEPVPGYLVEAAGLTDATPAAFAAAVEQDSDPPAAAVQETLGLFAGPGRVSALLLNSQTRTTTTDHVRRAAEAAGVPVVEVTETLPVGTSDYLAWMGAQIDALAAAVDRDVRP